MMRFGLAAWTLTVLGAAAPAFALVHSVSDFRSDNTGSASDTAFLDPTWGDSLLLDAKQFDYRSVFNRTMNDGIGNNGSSASSPAGTSTGLYSFRVAYLAWTTAHTQLNAPTGYPPRANVVTRRIDLSPDTAAVAPLAKIIAGQEIIPDNFTPTKFGYPNGGSPPPPSYLGFTGSGAKYAGYWGSLTTFGPIRRTSHKDTAGSTSTWGKYVTPATPVTASGFGEISSVRVPVPGNFRTVLAYDALPGGSNFEIRWEDIDAGTSVAVNLARPGFPEDLAAGADSAGNAVVLWRENANLYAVAYDSTMTQIMAPTLVQANVFFKDSVVHYYRPYAVAATGRGRFMIAYSRIAGSANVVYYRDLDLTALPPPPFPFSAEVAISGATDYSMYPDLTVARGRVAVAWFQRVANVSGAHRFMGSILRNTGSQATLTGRIDLDFAGEDISFAGIGSNWYRWHWLKCANIAMDDKGNILASYDNGYNAKVALVRNTPIYYDSGAFVSRILKVENPAIPAFAFNPASDSVNFLPFLPNATDTAHLRLYLADSPDSAFAAPGGAFLPLTSPRPTASGLFRYRVEMLTTKPLNLTTPKLKSLDIRYNVKPRTPRIDSIKIGAGPWSAYDPSTAYSALPRKDTLKLVCRGFDADDNGMEFRVSLGSFLVKSANGVRTSAGDYRADMTLMPPDTALNPLPLTLTTMDSSLWSSRPYLLSLVYRNLAPGQTFTFVRNLGRDSASVYRPSGGGLDTLVPVSGMAIVIQEGDSLAVKVRLTDGNDGNVNASWLRNSSILGTSMVPSGDSLVFRFTPDTSPPQVDTLIVRTADKDTTVVYKVLVRSNRLPEVDSATHVSYQGPDSLLKTGPFDKLRNFSADTGLLMPSGLSATVRADVSDPDAALDSLSVSWKVWKPEALCPPGDLSCYSATDSAQGAALTRIFSPAEEFLTVRVSDLSGAFLERRIWLEYPLLDTSASPGYSAAVKTLADGIEFIVGSDSLKRTVTAVIASKGSAALRIISVATQDDDKTWLDVSLAWRTGSPPAMDSIRFDGPTDANLLAGGSIAVAPGESLAISFRFSGDRLRGDSILIDTLFVQTNDFANPILKIPFRLVYNDFPLMRLGVPGSLPAGPAGGFNAAGLPEMVPAHSNLAVSFTETVRVSVPAALFRVYSLLDSLKNPAGFQTIPGTYSRRLKTAALAAKAAAVDTLLADSVLFTPRYVKASDSLKVLPAPGYFIYRDILRIAISNGITDKAGNGLDLRLDKAGLAAGTFDTVFQVRVDTGYFSVVSTRPASGEIGWNPDQPLRIRFNRKLSQRPPRGEDSLTLMDLGALKAESNRGIRIRSVFRPGQDYDFQFLTLSDGDSTLVIRTRPRFPALDTVTVSLSGGILDTSGLSLDGNGDKLPQWLYDVTDTTDTYTYTFTTLEADFYIFPNPFRFSDARHQEKGTITFKNLNTLKGYIPGKEVILRIHTMTGDLAYNSHTRPDPRYNLDVQKNTSLDWNLRNNSGNTVGSGVYIYTLMMGESRILRKGKVAVIR